MPSEWILPSPNDTWRFGTICVAHPPAAQAYIDLKLELRRRFPTDIQGYAEGKTEFARDIELRASRE